jgi:hypothetical protein
VFSGLNVEKPDSNPLKVIDVGWHLNFRKWNFIFLFPVEQTRQFGIPIPIDQQFFQTDILRPFMQPFLTKVAEFSVLDFVELQGQTSPVFQGKPVKNVPPDISADFAEKWAGLLMDQSNC